MSTQLKFCDCSECAPNKGEGAEPPSNSSVRVRMSVWNSERLEQVDFEMNFEDLMSKPIDALSKEYMWGALSFFRNRMKRNK